MHRFHTVRANSRSPGWFQQSRYGTVLLQWITVVCPPPARPRNQRLCKSPLSPSPVWRSQRVRWLQHRPQAGEPRPPRSSPAGVASTAPTWMTSIACWGADGFRKDGLTGNGRLFTPTPRKRKRAAPQARRPIRRGRFGGITGAPSPARRGWAAQPIPRRQAQRAGPDQRAGPKASAERSEGTIEARRGRDAKGGACASTTARSAMPLGRRRTHHASDSYGMRPKPDESDLLCAWAQSHP